MVGTQGTWFYSHRDLPAFADSTLETATVLHVHGCRSAANESGVAPMLLCNNRFCTQSILPARTPVQELGQLDDGVLVQTLQSGPFWLEKGTLIPCPAPPETIQRPRTRSHTILLPPPDFLMVDAFLGQGVPKWPRRRRPLKGGEVVFIRSEMQDKERELNIWRFFALSFANQSPVALVIDASIPFDSALNPGWSQCRPLSLTREGKEMSPDQVLFPAFPLPNGQEDPGWRSQTRS